MPIYAYRCTSCGHAKDVLQRMSDPLLSTCPACGASTFQKQLTAAGFQLKGSGWYVTDFRGNGSAPAAATHHNHTEPAADKPAQTASPAAGESSTPAADGPAAAPAGSSSSSSP